MVHAISLTIPDCSVMVTVTPRVCVWDIDEFVVFRDRKLTLPQFLSTYNTSVAAIAFNRLVRVKESLSAGLCARV
jgi:hypothetical protein